ncbi:MAG: hypothetical protein VX187_04325, partial [Pseudomonadota bacterium]|nr:hypothetical protein [Pseudomonadota bacterium]
SCFSCNANVFVKRRGLVELKFACQRGAEGRESLTVKAEHGKKILTVPSNTYLLLHCIKVGAPAYVHVREWRRNSAIWARNVQWLLVEVVNGNGGTSFVSREISAKQMEFLDTIAE